MLIRNEKGFGLIGVMMLVAAVIPPAILVAKEGATIVQKTNRYFQSRRVQQDMYMVRDFIIASAKDVDGDGFFELLKEGAGNSVPASLPVNPNDNYGTAYLYCTWDLGSANGADATYSQNNTAPPKAGMIGKIISAGQDRSFQTGCSDVNANGDDAVAEIFDANVKNSNGGISGWSHIGSEVTLLNPSDNVGLGVATPSHKLELAAGTTAAEGLALGDAELYRSGAKTWALGANNSFVIPSGSLQMNGGTVIDSSNNMTVSGGTLSMTNGTANSIVMGNAGIAAPTTGVRSAGTKLVLYPAVGAFTTDYALGIDNNTLWQSVPGAGRSFKWYAGTSNIMTLDGSGYVGIGTAPNASYSLNTAGAINASALYVGGTLVPTVVAGGSAGQTAYWDGTKWAPTSGLTYNAGTGAVSVTGGNLVLGANTITTSNTGLVANLNADMVDGYHLNQDVRTSASPTFAGLTLTGNLSLGVNTITSGNWNGATITPAYGGTGITAYTIGDLLYASGATTLSRLADVAAGNVLISGGVGAAPTWGKVGLSTHVSGILPVGNGGTGIDGSSAGSGKILIGNGSGYTLANVTGTANQVNVTNGAGSITLSLPQDIATTSTPTFGGMTLNGNLVLGGNTITTTNTTRVANLNADMTDGFHASQVGAASSLVTTDSTGKVILGSLASATTGAGLAQRLQIKQADDNYSGIKIERMADASFLGIGYYGGYFSLFPTYGAGGSYVPIAIWTSSGVNTVFANSGNVLIGTTTDDNVHRLQVSGGAAITGQITQNGGRNVLDTANVSGTTNYLPIFTGANTIGNSSIQVTGGNTFLTTSTGLSMSGIASSYAGLILNKVPSANGSGGFEVYDDASGYLWLAKAGTTYTSGYLGASAGATHLVSGYNDLFMGTNDSHAVVLSTNNGERMRVAGWGDVFMGYNGGNVYIGTNVNANSGAKLEVQGSELDVTGNVGYRGLIAAIDTTAQKQDVGGTLTLGGYNNGTSSMSMFGAVKGGKENGTNSADQGYISFLTSNSSGYLSEKVRISSNGNVGIGVSNPNSTLQLPTSGVLKIGDPDPTYSAGASLSSSELRFRDVNNYATSLKLNGYELSSWNLNSASPAGFNGSYFKGSELRSPSNYTSATIGNGGLTIGGGYASAIPLIVNGPPNAGDIADFNKGDSTRALAITFGGNVLIGTTTDAGYKLRVNGTGYFDGALTASGGAWSSSDARLKKDIVSLRSEGRVIDRIRQLNGVYYYWRRQQFPDRHFDSGRQVGVIAQNVEAVFPELVTTNKDGYKAVAYDKMAAVLIEGMKEQQSQLDDHEKRIQKTETDVEDIKDKEIARLKEENSTLQGRIAALEKWVTDFFHTPSSAVQ